MNDELQVVTGALAVSELEHQIEMARKYPRNWDEMVAEVEGRATRTKEIAGECFYSLPRKGKDGKMKNIEGPGVRFAELILASLNNIHMGTRVAETTHETVVGECIIYDLQTNKQFNVRETKSILNKQGGRYSADMIMTTGKAAIAVAKRNCIFQAVPMIEFEETLRKVKQIGTGAKAPSRGSKKVDSLEERRSIALKYFKNLGVNTDRVLFTLKLAHEDEIAEDELATLVGLRTAIKDGDTTINQAFPDPTKASDDIVDDIIKKK